MAAELSLGVLRSVLAFGGLGLFLALEAWRPFRAPRQSKLRHVASNLGIAGTNAVAVNLLFGGLLLVWAQQTAATGSGVFPSMGLIGIWNVVASLVVLDVIFWGVHRANHRVALLWRFHRAHHSDLDFDTTTALRFHLGEVLVSTGVKAASIVALGVSPAGLVVFEVGLALAAQWQHSNLRLPEQWDRALRAVIITPNLHRIHHSQLADEHQTNFGTILSCWDRVFATLRTGVKQEAIAIGLHQYPDPASVTFGRFWSMPFGARCRVR